MNIKSQKKLLLALVIFVVTVCALALPILPIELPKGVLNDNVFNEKKAELQEMAKKLSQEYRFQITDENRMIRKWLNESDRKRLYTKYKYQLAVKYGAVDGRKSILFDNYSIKNKTTTTYTFYSFIRSDLPYLVYDHDRNYAYIDPLKMKEVKEFSEKVASEFAYEDKNFPKLEELERVYQQDGFWSPSKYLK